MLLGHLGELTYFGLAQGDLPKSLFLFVNFDFFNIFIFSFLLFLAPCFFISSQGAPRPVQASKEQCLVHWPVRNMLHNFQPSPQTEIQYNIPVASRWDHLPNGEIRICFMLS